MHLPLLQARAPETTLCTYCPKLCRPACPVSTVEGRETFTPWGTMRAQDELRRGVGELSTGAKPDASRSAVAWACTGCGHCRELCLLDNPVADTLRDGRADAFALGIAPGAVATFVRNWPRRMQALRDRAQSLVRLVPGIAGRQSSTAYLPGCTAVTFESDAVAVTARGVDALTGGCDTVANGCCGAPLLEAGDRPGFALHAQGFAARLAPYERVVTADAGCAYALRVHYPAAGIAVPTVEHIAETAARHLEALHPLEDPRAVVYKDSCRLGRGLGVYNAPRVVLAALLGEAPREMPAHGARAECSGGGGLLPVTMPRTAALIAAERAGEVREAHPGAVVVTACAASRRQLGRQGIPVEDLAVWIARGALARMAYKPGTDDKGG